MATVAAQTFFTCFKSIGPIVLYQKSELLSQYKNFRQANYGVFAEVDEFCEKIDELLYSYRQISIPTDLEEIFEKVRRAKPFDLTSKERREFTQTVLHHPFRKESKFGKEFALMIMDELRVHMKYDREIIISQLDPSFIHDFSAIELAEIEEIMKLDTKPTSDPEITAQRHRIRKLIEV